MFERPETTYVSTFDERLDKAIMSNEANPLRRIVDLLPARSKILDVGCGNGILGFLLTNHLRDYVLDGVEPSQFACRVAAPFYRRCYNDFFQNLMPALASEQYDVAVLADVIEHVQQPDRFLSDVASVLKEGGRIFLSVPNVAFGAVRVALMNGAFEYVDSGLLERTHLRFFTWSTLEKTVAAAGLKIERALHLNHDILATEIQVSQYRVGLAELVRMARDPTASVYQYLLVLSRNGTASFVRESFGAETIRPLKCYLALRKARRQGKLSRRRGGVH